MGMLYSMTYEQNAPHYVHTYTYIFNSFALFGFVDYTCKKRKNALGKNRKQTKMYVCVCACQLYV